MYEDFQGHVAPVRPGPTATRHELYACMAERKPQLMAYVQHDTGAVHIDWALIQSQAGDTDGCTTIARILLAVRDGSVNPL